MASKETISWASGGLCFGSSGEAVRLVAGGGGDLLPMELGARLELLEQLFSCSNSLVMSSVRTALDHLHVSTFLMSIHKTKRAMQSLVFSIVCHPLSVNFRALNALSVIYNSTIE